MPKAMRVLLSFIGFAFVFTVSYTGTVSARTSSGDRLLSVVVMAQGNTISIKGYCVYVKDGKEIRKELEKDNTRGWNFRGEYIKEAKIQKCPATLRIKYMLWRARIPNQQVRFLNLII